MTKNGQDYTESQLRSLAYQTIESIVQPLLGQLQKEMSSVFAELTRDEDSPPTKSSTSQPNRDILLAVELTPAEHLAASQLYENGIMTWANFRQGVISAGIDSEDFPQVVASLRQWGLVIRTSDPGENHYQLTHLGLIYMDSLEEVLNGEPMD